MNLGPGESVAIETITVGDQARMEIAAARDAGIDPLEIARTHEHLARLIPALVRLEEKS